MEAIAISSCADVCCAPDLVVHPLSFSERNGFYASPEPLFGSVGESVLRHLLLLANIVTSKAPVTTSVALVTSSRNTPNASSPEFHVEEKGWLEEF